MAIEVPFINYLLPCCLNPTKQQFGYLLKLKKNVQDLSEAMSRLEAKLADIRRKVAEGEKNQEACTEEVADWVPKVIDVEQRLKKILKKYDQYLCLLNIWSSYRIGKRAFKMRAKVEKLIEQGSFQAVTAKPPSGGCQEMPCPTPVLGMESYLQQALGYISDDGVGIVGIWGMGGVGKTTLLQKINNTFVPGGGRNNEFDYVIWAVASKDSLQRLQERIFESLHFKAPDSAESYSQIIFNFLKNRSFLLLLDDLWTGVNLDEVGIPEPGSAAGGIKRKLVLTTRDVSVCGRMGASGAMIRIECLGWEDAWRLFEEKVGASIINSDPIIPPLARQVAEECDGLPLALTVVGRAMSIKTDATDWKFAVDSLQRSRILELPGAHDDNRRLLNILKLSYDHLPSEEIRRCFLLCSLWPEDDSISRCELIHCWMGMGVIGGSDDFEFRYNKYDSFISRLKEACLLEPGFHKDAQVKMHDIIRDLAIEIANKRSEGMWIVRAGVGLKAAPQKMEQATVISLMWNDIRALPQPLPEFPNLSTLVLQGNRHLHTIPANIYESFIALMYLDLSHTAVQELPSAISEIRKLQYLDLSYTPIRSLPEELKYLVNLKHLLLRRTHDLSVIPSGVISNLAELEELDLYRSHYAEWEVMEGEGDRGATFEELENNQNLKSLGITIKTGPTLAKLLQLSHVSTRRLSTARLSCHDLATPVQLTPQIIPQHICESLEEFTVSGLTGSRQLSLENPGGQSWCVGSLEILNFMCLEDLEAIIWKGAVAQEFLPNVRILYMVYCDKLKNASWILHLRRLEVVHFYMCKELTHIIDDLEDGQGEIKLAESVRTFPRLRTFVLASLPNLRSIAGHPLAFPSLEYIQVNHCDKLKKLPFQSQITDSLREIRGSRNWWECLEWDNDSIKSSLQSYFRILTQET